MVADLYQTCLLVLQVTEVVVVEEECLALTRDLLLHLLPQRLVHLQLLVHRQEEEEEGAMAEGLVEEAGR